MYIEHDDKLLISCIGLIIGNFATLELQPFMENRHDQITVTVTATLLCNRRIIFKFFFFIVRLCPLTYTCTFASNFSGYVMLYVFFLLRKIIERVYGYKFLRLK